MSSSFRTTSLPDAVGTHSKVAKMSRSPVLTIMAVVCVAALVYLIGFSPALSTMSPQPAFQRRKVNTSHVSVGGTMRTVAVPAMVASLGAADATVSTAQAHVTLPMVSGTTPSPTSSPAPLPTMALLDDDSHCELLNHSFQPYLMPGQSAVVELCYNETACEGSISVTVFGDDDGITPTTTTTTTTTEAPSAHQKIPPPPPVENIYAEKRLSFDLSTELFLRLRWGPDSFRLRLDGPEMLAGLLEWEGRNSSAARRVRRMIQRRSGDDMNGTRDEGFDDAFTYAFNFSLGVAGQYNVALERLYRNYAHIRESWNVWPPLLKEPFFAIDNASASPVFNLYHHESKMLPSADFFLQCRRRATAGGQDPSSLPPCTGLEKDTSGRWVVLNDGAKPPPMVYTRINRHLRGYVPGPHEGLQPEPLAAWVPTACSMRTVMTGDEDEEGEVPVVEKENLSASLTTNADDFLKEEVFTSDIGLGDIPMNVSAAKQTRYVYAPMAPLVRRLRRQFLERALRERPLTATSGLNNETVVMVSQVLFIGDSHSRHAGVTFMNAMDGKADRCALNHTTMNWAVDNGCVPTNKAEEIEHFVVYNTTAIVKGNGASGGGRRTVNIRHVIRVMFITQTILDKIDEAATLCPRKTNHSAILGVANGFRTANVNSSSSAAIGGYDAIVMGFAQHPASFYHWPFLRFKEAVDRVAKVIDKRLSPARRSFVRCPYPFPEADGGADAATAGNTTGTAQSLMKLPTIAWTLAPHFPHATRGFPIDYKDWRTDARLEMFNAYVKQRMEGLKVPMVDLFAMTSAVSHTTYDMAHYDNFVAYQMVRMILTLLINNFSPAP